MNLTTFFFTSQADAACSTFRVWTDSGGNSKWNFNGNWVAADWPSDSTESARVVAGKKTPKADTTTTISCLEVQSGKLSNSGNPAKTLTIVGDYLRNLNSNGITQATGNGWTIVMAGTAAQTIENVDPLNYVTITNNTTVTSTQAFTIRNALLLSGTTTLFNIDADLTLSQTGAFTVPSGVTVAVRSGATWTLNGNLTVNGTVRIDTGSRIVMANGTTLSVPSGGFIDLNGSAGNVAKIDSSGSGNSFTFNVAGILTADNFRIDRTDASGVNVTGTIQVLDNGEFHYIANAGAAITLGASASFPTTWSTIGFFDDDAHGNVVNVDASAYTLGVQTTISNWTGNAGTTPFGENSDLDTHVNCAPEPDGCIKWGSQGATKLTLSDQTASGNPAVTITQASADTLFATFAFALNDDDTDTDITSIKVTMTGTGSATDVDTVKIYRDSTPGNCVFSTAADANGPDVQIGSAQALADPVPTATWSITAGDVRILNTSSVCIHVVAATSATATDAKTLKFGISSTSDVTNVKVSPATGSYAFSTGAGPPLSAGQTTIQGSTQLIWNGNKNTLWNNTKNWLPKQVPTTAKDCDIGSGISGSTVINVANATCQNVTIKTGATINFNNSTNELASTGSLTVQSGVTFTASTPAGVLAAKGSSNQSIALTTTFPGDFLVANTGTSPTNVVNFSSDTHIQGNVIINSGNLVVNNGVTLTIDGNITVNSTGQLTIDQGGILTLGNNSVVTINDGATPAILKMVGTASNAATMTSDAVGSSYNVIVNGIIEARYYVFDHLNASGLLIANVGTNHIDATNHLQNGTFKHPKGNNTTFLFLDVPVPTNSMDSVSFSLDGSSATGYQRNIDTFGAAAGTLTLNSYTGDLAGATYDNDDVYLLSWLGATNTIKVTEESSNPTSVNAGSTYTMGNFGFQQALAGASYNNTDITSLKITMTGTGSASDISAVRLYYDDNCDATGGVLVDSGTLSGSPPSYTFTATSGEITVQADTSSPPKRCAYVQYDIALGAGGTNTVGVKLASSSDLVNSESYNIDASTPAPIDLGNPNPSSIVASSSTVWTGNNLSTSFTDPLNWTAGVPDLTKNCTINNGTWQPTIAAGTNGACKNVTIGTGTLTLGDSAAALKVYGSYVNSGTLVQNSGHLIITDVGDVTTQSVSSTTKIDDLEFDKAAGGTVNVSGTTLQIDALTTLTNDSYELVVPSGQTLQLNLDTTLNGGILHIQGGGTLKMESSKILTVDTSATLKMVGGSAASLAQMTSTGGGLWYAVDIINTGAIEARYCSFDHLGNNGTTQWGVTVGTSAGINVTNHFQDCVFTYPVVANTKMLTLNRAVPSNTMDNVTFDKNGSAVAAKNIDTSGGGTAGPLVLTGWAGDFAGDADEVESGTYAINWVGGVNTIDITDQSGRDASFTAGSTHNMGRFGFKQTLAGSFTDADITSIKLTRVGTNQNLDIDQIRIYFVGSGCANTGGTLIGTGTLTGSPGTVTFALNPADATIPAHATTTVMQCIRIEADIASGAIDTDTAGFQIATSSHFANDQAYPIATLTPAPISLGSSAIIGSAATSWTGGAGTTAWETTGNWSAGKPDATKNCTIADQTFDPVISAATAICKNVNITNGIVTLNGGQTWQVSGDFTNTGTFAQTGTLEFTGTATQTINSSSALTNLTTNKSAGSILVGTSPLQITTLTFPGGGTSFNFNINSGKVLILSTSTTVDEASLNINTNGTLKMANATTLTVAAAGTLKMKGSATTARAKLDSNGASNAYAVAVNGTLIANYYNVSHLGVAGFTINSGATIDATDHLQNGEWIHPVADNTTMLTLNRKVLGTPTNHLIEDLKFDTNSAPGVTASTIVNINTMGTAVAGDTLTVNPYTGDLAGDAFEDTANTGTNYPITWAGGLNTIKVASPNAPPASVDAGSTYKMGSFSFVQALPGSGFVDTDITDLKLEMTGTASASDISQVRIYYDINCTYDSPTAGTLVGTASFSGSPLKATFASIAAGDIRIHKDATTPPTRCLYVEMDISGSATDGKTVGVRISTTAGDFINSASYTVDGTTPLPEALGNATIVGSTSTSWTGATSTAWNLDSNWTAGQPNSTKTCNISDVTNDPIIDNITASCKNVNITNGILVMQNASAVLEVYGNFSNTGTFTQNNLPIKFIETGSATAQTLTSSSAIQNLTFDKKIGGGTVRLLSTSLTVTTLNFPTVTTNNFEFQIPSGTTLTSTNSITINEGTLTVEGGGTLLMTGGTTLTVAGGKLKTTGVNDTAPQTLTNKGKIDSVSGTWTLTATSGTIDFVGFLFDDLDVNGVNIGGTTTISNFRGGQIRNLSNTYASVKAIQINTDITTNPSGTQWDNIGWNWTPNNTTPTSADAYLVATSTGCSGGTATFTGWFGDWFENVATFDVSGKVSGASCTIALGAAASPVSLLSLTATGYNTKIALDWVTGSEIDHQGFNVYRSTNPSSGYVQINSKLVRNIITPNTYKGIYNYIDSGLNNGQAYYYMIEDVALNGNKVKHGPVNATPDANAGNPPVPGGGTNSDGSTPGGGTGNDPTNGTIQTPGLVDLGNGVHILSQTENSFRIEIIPPPEAWSASTWDGSYQTLSVPGYSSTLQAGYPELVERVIFVEVGSAHSTAAVTNSSQTEILAVAHKVQPAPSWAPDGGGTLQPSYGEDASAYSTVGYMPTSYFSVENAIKQIGQKYYVEIKATPFIYDAPNQLVNEATKIVLDIALDGTSTWDTTPPTNELALSPSAVDGALRIRYKNSGMHELRFDDMATAYVEGPFAGRDFTNFRMYQQGVEIPIDIVSADGLFNTGDAIRFNANFLRHLEDNENEVVLAPFNLMASADPALRMNHIDGAPGAEPFSPELGTFARTDVEENNYYHYLHPIGGNIDHFYWGFVYAERGGPNNPYPAAAQKVLSVPLPNLLQNSDKPVRLRTWVVGWDPQAVNVPHSIGVYVNNTPFLVAVKTFTEQIPVMLEFDIDASYFFAGTNTVTLLARGDTVPAGHTDIISINRIQLDYEAARTAVNDVADVMNANPGYQFTIKGFSTNTNITVYDISTQTDQHVSILDNTVITDADLDGIFDVDTGTLVGSGADFGHVGRHFIAIADGNYLKPSALALAQAADYPLQSTTQGADLIMVGPKALLDAADALKTARENEGLRVVKAPLKQIYAEFSHGLRSSQGIRDFLLYAYNNWQQPKPRYVIFIGDGTYDPLDHEGNSRADAKDLMPVPFSGGRDIDYGDDNWFVASEDGSGMPLMAVGRVPSSNAETVEDYITKILNYEAGTISPLAAGATKAVFVSDQDQNVEYFAKNIGKISAALTSVRSDYQTVMIDKTTLGSGAATKSALIAAINDGPLLVTYLGHGGEGEWSNSGSVFNNSDADALTNSKLPIVLALNCLNSVYYQAYEEDYALGEKFILNKNGGAIAFWGSTAMTIPTAQMSLAQNFINAFGAETVQTSHDVRLGDLMMHAKQALGSTSQTKDTLQSWTLLGDPTIKLPPEAFTAAAAPPAETPQSSGGGGGKGGFLSCGSIGNGGSGGGGSGLAGFLELLLLISIMIVFERLQRLQRLQRPKQLRAPTAK